MNCESVLAELKADGMQALIIDLRNNSGGLLNVAVEIADLFVLPGRIVSTVGRDHVELERFDAYRARAVRPIAAGRAGQPFSASASEIVAACYRITIGR